MKAGLMVVGIVGAVLAGVSSTANAEDPKYDGNELLSQCQQYIKVADSEPDYDRIDAGMCMGFVQGVYGTFSLLSEELNDGIKFCVPGSVTNSQLVRVVVKYLKNHPAQLNLYRTGLVWSALKEAYPCK
ncbi:MULTISPECIES: Rap1a/Tai family immunity protein [Pseudomonas]|jgi:hypothetical protein|uniref:Rap1a/Tai family immunity protein n=1 Tax=Pseudomonas TaxID=286 RepID=UPI0005FC1B09|nr:MULTISPECIES: Rap1a/Tai family immunity protein [Pseudomonas]KJZ40913.1 hypothetical protein VC33_03255 [Pseudomonas fluorescens]OOG11575.1 hypothetical protein BMS17_05560 [Pseudomonas sp. C9]